MNSRARERRDQRMQDEQHGPWYLLTGLVLGLIVGLVYALWLSPVQYIDTAPEVLRAADKDQYRILVALSFKANGDLGRASQRLAQLHDAAPEAPLAELAQRLVADNDSIEIARALAQLAAALVQPGSVPTEPTTAVARTGAPFSTLENDQAIQTATPQPTATPVAPTLPPLPTVAPRITAVPTLGAPFALKDRLPVCDPAVEDGLIQVLVLDGAGNPLAGIKITVAWQSGEETFFTGLTPKISPGYADYRMSEGYTYLVTAGDGGEQAGSLTTGECTASDGSRRLSGWKLIFVLP